MFVGEGDFYIYMSVLSTGYFVDVSGSHTLSCCSGGWLNLHPTSWRTIHESEEPPSKDSTDLSSARQYYSENILPFLILFTKVNFISVLRIYVVLCTYIYVLIDEV